MTKIRELLAENPVSFNELLDLFERYVATIGAPLRKGINLIRDEFHYVEGDIFGHICGVEQDASDIAKRLTQIRAERNKGSDVTITLTDIDAFSLESAMQQASRTISDATTVLAGLHRRATCDDTGESSEAIAIMALTHRALSSSEDQEVGRLLRFAAKIKEASKYAQMEGEEAA